MKTRESARAHISPHQASTNSQRSQVGKKRDHDERYAVEETKHDEQDAAEKPVLGPRSVRHGDVVPDDVGRLRREFEVSALLGLAGEALGDDVGVGNRLEGSKTIVLGLAVVNLDASGL